MSSLFWCSKIGFGFHLMCDYRCLKPNVLVLLVEYGRRIVSATLISDRISGRINQSIERSSILSGLRWTEHSLCMIIEFLDVHWSPKEVVIGKGAKMISLTCGERSRETPTNRVSWIVWARFPICGPWGPSMPWLETLGDKLKCWNRWRACIRSASAFLWFPWFMIV